MKLFCTGTTDTETLRYRSADFALEIGCFFGLNFIDALTSWCLFFLLHRLAVACIKSLYVGWLFSAIRSSNWRPQNLLEKQRLRHFECCFAQQCSRGMLDYERTLRRQVEAVCPLQLEGSSFDLTSCGGKQRHPAALPGRFSCKPPLPRHGRPIVLFQRERT